MTLLQLRLLQLPQIHGRSKNKKLNNKYLLYYLIIYKKYDIKDCHVIYNLQIQKYYQNG